MLGNLLQADLLELVQSKQWDELRSALILLDPSDVAEILVDLPRDDESMIFRILPRELAANTFAHLPMDQQEELILSLSGEQMKAIFNDMSPDDRTRLLEELPDEVTRRWLDSLSPQQLQTARILLGYPPDSAGRYMTPNYITLRPNMTVAEAMEHIRRSPRATETLSIVYVVGSDGQLLKELRLGSLVRAEPTAVVNDLVDRPLIAVPAQTDREQVVQWFNKYDRFALPVIDERGHMLGILTLDDVIDVVQEEATEDMHKISGMEALDAPYSQVSMLTMLRKRGGWLSILFIGEMFTATAMGHFENEIARAVVLALFVPLIISSGGNSGSQAATLIIRALALNELHLRDWWRVFLRECGSGLSLGAWLGGIGFLRVLMWQWLGWVDYGPNYLLIGTTVWLSLIGVVCFGSLAGSMLPFILRSLRLDPATSSAPFVATMVDVTGLVIYFLVASLILHGTML